MLQRVLEPEWMDSPEEARDYNNMDHREVNRVFVDDLCAVGFQGGDVLDIGTGTALIPIEIAQRGIECRIMAADAAVAMLERARLNLEIAGLMRVVQLSQCDAKAMPYANGMFDWTLCNGTVHHIPDPARLWQEAWRVTRGGGRIFFRDLLRPESASDCDRLVDLHAAGCNAHQREMFRRSLLAGLSLAEVQAYVASFNCPPETVRVTSDRHWTWIATKP